jgi:hypothetical protein
MNTEISFLKQLETDLKDAAVREMARLERATLQGSIRKNTGRGWTKVVGVAAAFLVVAGAIGFLAQGGLTRSVEQAGSGSADKFQGVGDAVPGDGATGSGGGVGYVASPPQPHEVAPSGEEPDAFAPATPGTGENSIGVIDTSHDPAVDDSAVGRQAAGRQQQDLSKIIRDGRIGIVVPDKKFGDAVGDLTFIAEKYGGFVLSSSTNNDRSGTFVLRIPAKGFDRAVSDIRDLATHVRFQEIEGDDVTAEFIDLQARLRILKARKALLFGLFQKATTTEEILRMSSQLDDVQLRIEQIQGQINFINDQVAESTLRVSIQEQNAPEAAATSSVDNPDLGSSVDLAVQGFLRIVGAVIVGLGYLIPLTLLGAIVWFVVWTIRRSRAIS